MVCLTHKLRYPAMPRHFASHGSTELEDIRWRGRLQTGRFRSPIWFWTSPFWSWFGVPISSPRSRIGAPVPPPRNCRKKSRVAEPTETAPVVASEKPRWSQFQLHEKLRTPLMLLNRMTISSSLMEGFKGTWKDRRDVNPKKTPPLGPWGNGPRHKQQQKSMRFSIWSLNFFFVTNPRFLLRTESNFHYKSWHNAIWLFFGRHFNKPSTLNKIPSIYPHVTTFMSSISCHICNFRFFFFLYA